jgi:hypothetical protein
MAGGSGGPVVVFRRLTGCNRRARNDTRRRTIRPLGGKRLSPLLRTRGVDAMNRVPLHAGPRRPEERVRDFIAHCEVLQLSRKRRFRGNGASTVAYVRAGSRFFTVAAQAPVEQASELGRVAWVRRLDPPNRLPSGEAPGSWTTSKAGFVLFGTRIVVLELGT